MACATDADLPRASRLLSAAAGAPERVAGGVQATGSCQTISGSGDPATRDRALRDSKRKTEIAHSLCSPSIAACASAWIDGTNHSQRDAMIDAQPHRRRWHVLRGEVLDHSELHASHGSRYCSLGGTSRRKIKHEQRGMHTVNVHFTVAAAAAAVAASCFCCSCCFCSSRSALISRLSDRSTSCSAARSLASQFCGRRSKMMHACEWLNARAGRQGAQHFHQVHPTNAAALQAPNDSTLSTALPPQAGDTTNNHTHAHAHTHARPPQPDHQPAGS